MGSDVVGLTLLHGQPLGRIAVAESLDQILRIALALLWEADPRDAFRHLLVYLHGGVRLERRMTTEQLESQDAQRPPVQGVRVALGGDELGREVVGRAAGGVCPADDHLLLHEPVGAAEVDQPKYSSLRDHDVLRLRVLMHHAHVVDQGKGLEQLFCKILHFRSVNCIRCFLEGLRYPTIEVLAARSRVLERNVNGLVSILRVVAGSGGIALREVLRVGL
mmetsp:Transcript_120573/g.352157  ORF Transcript_120573/g.352157 Transcript_120573/m.352157 type:complete len:220 (+) Transcript_120573:463-1122(+)